MKPTRAERFWNTVAELPEPVRVGMLISVFILVLLVPTCAQSADLHEGPVTHIPDGKTATCLNAAGCIVMTSEFLRELLRAARESVICTRKTT